MKVGLLSEVDLTGADAGARQLLLRKVLEVYLGRLQSSTIIPLSRQPQSHQITLTPGQHTTMAPTDPCTNLPLAEDAILRTTHNTPTVHIYAIPPLTSTTGFRAGPWTSSPNPTAKQIFTARVRVLESSHHDPANPDSLKVDILLEDPKTGDLFAAAPYTSAAVVQQAMDSSRFFAVRVQGEGGMKATLGMGFEDRAEAFDFGLALGEAGKVLGFERRQQESVGLGGGGGGEKEGVKRDWSLKEGEKISINVGAKGKRNGGYDGFYTDGSVQEKDDGAALFSIAPPPSGASQSSAPVDNKKAAADFGFDDGEFGEFQ